MTIALHQIPMARGLPLLGHLRDFRLRRHELFLRASRECGDVALLRLGPRRLVLFNAPALIQSVLVEHADAFEKSPMLRTLSQQVLGNGLLTSENEFHKRQRRLIAPAFQHRRIAAYADVMAAYTERLQQEWADGATVDIAHEMMRLTLWIVGKTLFDADVLGEAEELGAALNDTMHAFTAQLTSPIPPSWPLPRNLRANAATERLNATVYRMIADRRSGGGDRGDLLSMLLAAQDEDGSFMTDQQVRDESMTLFLAGHETTANALAWAWFLLAQHPRAAERMRAEVDAALGGRTPEMADLPRLPYTLQVLKEAMRLYPPAFVFGRQATRPVRIGDYDLPTGTIVMVSPFALHRRPDFFPEPERFNPKRFAPEAEALLPRYSYLPFGGGPRICIGNHFAMMEGHLALAALAQRVRLELLPGQRIQPEPLVTLRPRGGIKMRVSRR